MFLQNVYNTRDSGGNWVKYIKFNFFGAAAPQFPMLTFTILGQWLLVISLLKYIAASLMQ